MPNVRQRPSAVSVDTLKAARRLGDIPSGYGLSALLVIGALEDSPRFDGKVTGAQVAREIREAVADDAADPHRQTVYKALGRLEDRGFVAVQRDGPSNHGFDYRLTDETRELLAALARFGDR